MSIAIKNVVVHFHNTNLQVTIESERYGLLYFSEGSMQSAPVQYRTLHVKECFEIVLVTQKE